MTYAELKAKRSVEIEHHDQKVAQHIWRLINKPIRKWKFYCYKTEIYRGNPSKYGWLVRKEVCLMPSLVISFTKTLNRHSADWGVTAYEYSLWCEIKLLKTRIDFGTITWTE